MHLRLYFQILRLTIGTIYEISLNNTDKHIFLNEF